MAITKKRKVEVIKRVTDVLKEAATVVFVRFKGLSVLDTTAMRKDFRDSGVGYYVAKKTLIRRALAENKYLGELPELPGEIALAWSSEDPTAAARGIYERSRKHKGALTIMGGIFEGAYLSPEKMLAIASIPPLPILRGMFVNVINAPIQGLVIALDQIREKKSS